MKMKVYLTVLLALFLSTPVSAQLIQVKVSDYGVSNSSAPAKAAIDLLVSELETELNSSFPKVDSMSKYLEGMANGGVIATKGQGTDYANDIDLFLFGVNMGAGIAAGSDGLSLSSEDVEGFGVNGSILFGMSLGIFDLPAWEWFDPNRIRVFFNMLPPGLVKQESGEQQFELGHFGVHARYQLMEGVEGASFGLLKWGGLFIHAGLEQSSATFAQEQIFSAPISLSGGSSATATGPATIGAEVSTFSIPIEISTYGQLGYIFTFYTGLGVDIATSNASSIVEMNLSSTMSYAGGDDPTLAISADLGEEASGDTFSVRYFAGLQLNAPVWKPIYIHLNGGLGNGTYGITAGTKFTW